MRRNRSALSQVLSLVDPKTGIISSVSIFQNLDRDPKLACAVSNAASSTPLIGFDFDNRGAACASDAASAVLRACGETIERYSSSIIPWEQLVRTTATNLKQRARVFDVGNFYPFSTTQYGEPNFPYRAPSPDTEKYWACARDWQTGAIVYVPASCVYLPYAFPDEPVTHAPISTGLAAGLSLEDCAQKAAAEIIERDAFMIRWKCAIAAPAVDIETCRAADSELARLLSSTDHLPGEWRINLLTLDIETAVISAAFQNYEGSPLTSFGIAADANPIAATRSAIREALLSRFLLNRSSEAHIAENLAPNFRTLRGHLLGHALSERLRDAFLDLFGAAPTLAIADIVGRFGAGATPLRALTNAGLSALLVDVTSPDVAAAGINVVRALAPFAEPLDNDHEAQHLGGKRLRQWARRQNVAAFNANPHPFP